MLAWLGRADAVLGLAPTAALPERSSESLPPSVPLSLLLTNTHPHQTLARICPLGLPLLLLRTKRFSV